MASNSKNIAELLNGDVTVTTADIADDAVTSAKIAASPVFTGNVGVGVTPNAGWSANNKVLDFGYHGSVSTDGDGSKFGMNMAMNAYAIGGADPSSWKYKTSGAYHASLYHQTAGSHNFYVTDDTASTDAAISFTNAMTIANTGGVGVGVVPSNWKTSSNDFLPLQIANSTTVYGRNDVARGGISMNAYVDATNDRWEYRANGVATNFYINDGNYTFQRAASGVADNAITWIDSFRIHGNGDFQTRYGSAGGYAQTSGNGGLYYREDTDSTGGSLIISNDSNNGWSPIYLNKFDWSAGQDERFIQFTINGSGACGYIKNNGAGALQFLTSSDYRLKTDIQDISNPIDRVKLLNPINFEWIADNTRTDGFIAHEVDAIIPEAISGVKDAMHAEVLYTSDDELPDGVSVGDVKEESTINAQGIDQSKFVPLLTAALQEAIAKIEALETKVQALEDA
jgi:hypothetical protein